MKKILLLTLIMLLSTIEVLAQDESPIEIPKGNIKINSYYLKDCNTGEFDDSFTEVKMSWIWNATDNNNFVLKYSIDGVIKIIQIRPAFKVNRDEETGETWVTFEGINGEQIITDDSEECLFCDESKITHDIDKIVLLFRRYSDTEVEFITLYEGECNKERFYTPEE